MKIGINARFLSKPYTGIGQYTKALFSELARLDTKNSYIFVCHENPDLNALGKLPSNLKVKIIKEIRIGSAGMKKTWWEQIQLPEFFEKEKMNMVFFPYPSNPWTLDWYKKGIKTVLTVHDVIPWKMKNYRKSLLSKMYHAQTKKAVKMADLILTVSENSKKDISETCAVKKNKIQVLHNAVNFDSKTNLKVLKKFKLKSKEFFLYVGGYDERKNVPYLMEEFKRFVKFDSKIPLVLAGGKLLNGKLYKSFDQNQKNVIKTGFLPEGELRALYENCLAFVNVSREEGFNIPIVEAAGCSAPIILSDIPVHREIAGENALFVDINKEFPLAYAMRKMTENKTRSIYVKKSSALSKKYSWKKSAKKLKDMLKIC